MVFAIAAFVALDTAPDLGAQEQQEAPPAPTPGASGGGGDAGQEQPRPRQRRPRDPEKVHDPSTVVASGGVRRLFGTGRGVTLMRETPDGKWLPEGRLFEEGELPAWHTERVPGNRGHLWAPDVIEHDGWFLVYYSVSRFGRNTSAIGLARGRTVDPNSPDWGWEDLGPVFASQQDDPYNAIDPALFRDPADGSLWMSFGSFWDGIHLVELDPESGLRLEGDAPPHRLASHPEIEAPFIHHREGRYYLFVNWGRCCRGVESTYEIRVGSSDQVTGPYLDRDGKDLRDGGGTAVLGTDGRWIGPGHASIHHRDGGEWLVHHYYDGELDGRSRLRMVPLVWDDEGWPVAAPATESQLTSEP